MATGCMNNNQCDFQSGLCKCGTGTACNAPQTCVMNGTSASCQVTCGFGNQVCGPGTVCSNGQCICGSGNQQCQQNQSCVAGVCLNNCGSGGPCAAGQVCSAGTGTCIATPFGGPIDFDLRDLDADGHLDIVASNFTASYSQQNRQWQFAANRQAMLGVFLGKAGGGFNPPLNYAIGTATGVDAVDVAIANLDHVSGLDAVISVRAYVQNTNTETWTVMALLNDGTGHLAPPASPTGAFAGPFSGRVVAKVADFNHDGFADVALLSGVTPTFPSMTYTQALAVHYGDGTGHFGNPTTVGITSPLTGVYAYADCSDAQPTSMQFDMQSGQLGIGNLNGDQKVDVFVRDRVYLSTGRAVGSPGKLEGSNGSAGGGGLTGGPGGPTLLPAAGGPVVSDVDGDGKAEVVTVSVQTDSMGMNPKAVLQVGHVNPPNVHSW